LAGKMAARPERLSSVLGLGLLLMLAVASSLLRRGSPIFADDLYALKATIVSERPTTLNRISNFARSVGDFLCKVDEGMQTG